MLMRALGEQIAMGFACDRMRAVNIVNWGTNPQGVKLVPGVSADWHGLVGHNQPSPGKGFYEDRYSLECELMRGFLELVAALKRIPEGKGTLLDSTTILVVSEHSGEHHTAKQPHFALMAGGGGWKADGTRQYKTGRYIKLPSILDGTFEYAKAGQMFSGLRSANDLVLTFAHGAGVTRAKDNKGVMREFSSFGHPDYTRGLIAGILS
jgi:hypothetical protein